MDDDRVGEWDGGVGDAFATAESCAELGDGAFERGDDGGFYFCSAQAVAQPFAAHHEGRGCREAGLGDAFGVCVREE